MGSEARTRCQVHHLVALLRYIAVYRDTGIAQHYCEARVCW